MRPIGGAFGMYIQSDVVGTVWSMAVTCPIDVLGGNPHIDISVGSLKASISSSKSSQPIGTSSKPAKSSGDNISNGSNGDGGCASSEFGA